MKKILREIKGYMNEKTKKITRPTKAGLIALITILSIAIVAYAASLIISKTFKTNLKKGEILSMQLVQTDVEGTVSPGDTIDVAPIIYNDGTIKGTALMRVSYPMLSNGSPAYSWTIGAGWSKVTDGTGYTVYGYGSPLDGGGRTEEPLMSGMTMVEMSGEEFKGLADVNVTVDGWLADSEQYGDDSATVWTRIQSGN